jgi:CheY-like chemotaxis protein
MTVPCQSVLIVDDEPDILELVGLLLESEGYRTLRASSGAEALALAAAEPIDLVLLDIMMPELDGIEVLGRLRAEPATVALPVVMLTARNDVSAIASSLAGGADGFVAKPFDLGALVELVALRLRGDPGPFYRSETPLEVVEEIELDERHALLFLHLVEPDDDHSVLTNACEGCHHRLLSLWQEPLDEGRARTTALLRVGGADELGRMLNLMFGGPAVRVQDCSVYRHWADIPADIMQGGRR